MMKVNYLILALLTLSNCSSWKHVLVSEGGTNEAIKNAIYDFSRAAKKSSSDSVFYVYTKDLTSEVLGVNIFGTYDKVLVSTEDTITFSYQGFPTAYLENQGRLFYWHDSTQTVSSEVLSVFNKYNLIDTMIVNAYIPERTIDHSKKGVDYFFCKRNLLN